MKRIICLFLILCLALCLVSCKEAAKNNTSSSTISKEPSQTKKESSLELLYSYGDSLNPYLSKTTLNRQISSLLFDGLVKVNNNFEPVFVLAESVKIDKNICTVNLRDAVFTDSSAVTADDVIYSYNLAKENPRYMHNFYEVVSLTAVNSKTLSFELSQHDPYFTNLLTFPILKSGSSGLTDADGKEILPIGCGRYVLSKDKLNLEQNENYFGKKSSITKINLVNSPDQASTSHYVEVGIADVYYTESENIIRMSGKKTDVSLNRLVYIGINNNVDILKSKEIRYAISAAIDREAVCRTAFYNKADSATGFLNPNFKPTEAIQTIGEKPNSKITVENLSKIGYNNMNSDGFYANSNGNVPTLTLLVNSENVSRVTAAKLISEQCRAVGIKIDVVECTFEQYLERLTNGDFELYIGEVQILNNMDFTQLVTPDGSAAYGVKLKETEDKTPTNNSTSTNSQTSDEAQESEIVKSYCETMLESYHNGSCSITDVATTLLTEMPQIPVCYLNGVMFYNSDIKNVGEASMGDIYFNIENYEF